MRRLGWLRRTAAIWGSMLIAMVALFALPAVAQEDRRLVLNPSQAPFGLAKYAEYLIEQGKTDDDWAMRMQLADLVALDDRAFAPVETREIGFGWNPSIVHLRVRLENPTDQPQDWLLSFNQIKWGQGIVSLVVDDESIPSDPVFSFKQGELRSVSDRIVKTNLTLPADAMATLYVSYVNPGSTAPLSIESPADYEKRRLLGDIWIYILIGLVVGVMFLTVSIIGVLHQRVAVYYAGYVTTATIHFCFILNLFGPSDLLTSVTQYIYSLYVWGAVSSVFYMLFQYAFFATEESINDRYRKAFLGAAGINALLLIGFSELGMPYSFYILWSLICLALIIVNGVLAIVRQITGGIFFAIGCFALAATVMPLALSDFLTAHYTTEMVTMLSLYGIAIEAITLSIAMFAKVRRMRFERSQALKAELELTKDKLDAIRRMATAAHDIQQPLTALRIALAENGDGRAKPQDIDSAIDYLDEIVRTQMADAKSDLSENEEPQETAVEEFDLSFVLETLRAMFAEEAAAKGLRLRIAPTKLRVKTNPLALTRILSNLITNAIRNTDSGGILIGGRRRGADVRIDVTDTGPGLEGATLADLQRPFARNNIYDGHGLGLSSVRNLCKEHGLKFRCTSDTDRGTTFHISVPKAAVVARIATQQT